MRMRRLAWSVLGCVLAAMPVAATEPAEHPATVAPPPDLALIDEIPNLAQQLVSQWDTQDMAPGTRVYLDDVVYYGRLRDLGTPQRLSLADCIALAIANNTQLQLARLGPLGARVQIRRAQSVFDPTVFSNVNLERTKQQSASFRGISEVLVDGEPQDLEQVDTGALAFFLGPPTTEQHTLNGELGARKLLRSGGQLSLNWTNQRRKSNSPFQALSPEYTSSLNLSLNQPLLRDFGLHFTTLQVRIARTGADAAVRQYEGALANLVKNVELAYWLLVGTRENVAVREAGQGVANELLRQNRGKFEVGTLPRTAVLEAQADVARREADLIQARKAHTNARDALRAILNVKHLDLDALIIVEPADEPLVQTTAFDLEESLRIALEQRPELAAARLQLEGQGMQLDAAENQLLPRLNAVGLFGTHGLGGGQSTSQRPFEQVVTTEDSNGDGLRDVVGVLAADITQQSPYDDSYSDTLGNLFSGDYYSYAAGLMLEIPIGNAAAEADYAQSKVSFEQSRLSLRQLQETVTAEVKKAVNDLEADVKAIEATRIARELAEENVRNQHARYEVGLGTTKDLLDFQDLLTSAGAEEVRALTQYRIDLAELRRVQGTLLESHNVELETGPEEGTPWWATF